MQYINLHINSTYFNQTAMSWSGIEYAQRCVGNVLSHDCDERFKLDFGKTIDTSHSLRY